MELVVHPPSDLSRIGVLPGSFNPPTRAHLDLAASALGLVDAVLFVLPREFPHKNYEGTSLAQRIELLRLAAGRDPRFGVGIAEGGLFIEMVRECRSVWPSASFDVLCGRDAAERIINWNYGEAGSISRQLDEFGLLVAPRDGSFDVPPELAGKVRHLAIAPCDGISATEVRRRIAVGEQWDHLVPPATRDRVVEFYAPRG